MGSLLIKIRTFKEVINIFGRVMLRDIADLGRSVISTLFFICKRNEIIK